LIMAAPSYSYWPEFIPDLAFFDTCTANIVYYSNKCSRRYSKVYCRIHSVGMRFNHHRYVDWNNKVDGIIFVNERLQEQFHKDLPEVSIPTCVVHNGVDLNKFTLKKSFEPTYKIAVVSRKIVLKNLEALPEILTKFKEVDERYDLNLADGRIPHDSMNEWLEDKDYLVHPSKSESFCYAVAEAMAKGIRPLINNWPGAIETFGEEFLLDNFNLEQDPQRFRNFISNNYNQEQTILNINTILDL